MLSYPRPYQVISAEVICGENLGGPGLREIRAWILTEVSGGASAFPGPFESGQAGNKEGHSQEWPFNSV